MKQEQQQAKGSTSTSSTSNHSAEELKKRVDREKVDAIKAEMDDILDEIDSVLVENAEEFVKSYRQKGGE